MKDVSPYLPLLRTGQWFSHLPRPLQDELLNHAQVRRLQSGERLFHRGDQPCGLYAVVEGAMRVGAVSVNGKEALLTLVEPPYWFGEISLFDGQPRTHDAFAEGPTVLLHVAQSALNAMLQRQPAYWRDFALLMSQKLRLAFIALEQISLLPATPRLAQRLLMIADNYGEGDPRRVLHLAQEQLALMLAISRQTTNQILKELQAQGIVRLTYGEIEIVDLERLQAVAEGEV